MHKKIVRTYSGACRRRRRRRRRRRGAFLYPRPRV